MMIHLPRTTCLICIALFLGGARPSVAADSLQGAAEILRKAAEQTAAPGDKAGPPAESMKLRKDLTNFTARASTLAPDAAAREWLALFDRVPQGRAGFGSGGTREQPVQMTELVAALPPPAAWDALARAIEQRPEPKALKDVREIGLRLLAHTLTGDRKAQTADLATFEKLLTGGDRQQAMQLVRVYTGLNNVFLKMSDDTNGVIVAVERQIAEAERQSQGRFGGSYLQLPDLVSIAGEARAETFLRRAIKSGAENIRIEGRRTQALARKIALELVPEMKKPMWDLCHAVDATGLFEAMEKKFARPEAKAPAIPGLPAEIAELQESAGFEDYELQQARTYYIVGLIAKDRGEDAAAYARKTAKGARNFGFPHDAIGVLDRAGKARALDDFLHALLTESPELPFWNDYFQIAAKTGTTERMLELARKAAARPGFSGRKSVELRENLHQALLAADKLEEGVKELRALLAASKDKSDKGSANDPRAGGDGGQHGLRLARLGQLMDRKDWMEEGIAVAREALTAKEQEEARGYRDNESLMELTDLLQDTGRAAEAEELILSELVRATRQQQAQAAQRASRHFYPGQTDAAAGVLGLLVRFYHRADRPQDVLTVFETAGQWGVKDLAQLVGSSGHFGGFRDPRFETDPAAFHAAAALAETGRKAEALAIVNALLDQNGGFDPAYELLTQLARAEDAMARLDELFARDPFEERPLIWKGLLLHQAGRNKEAEEIIRQAIGIDPSDGEQGPGRRMRVYAVLADIRTAVGDAKEAEFMREVVRSIRMSERADSFYHAGLLTRAIGMYQDALKHFTDAYCIQSRLAIQMSALGMHDEAEKHYQKAFELMPDSFGRVESHCFGCEHTFSSQQAQGIAERVFVKLAEKRPDKPQIHYLLGYLRSEQGMPQEALGHISRATELDPDYLNAWQRIMSLNEQVRLSTAVRDEAAFNILRLDPLGRHAQADLSQVGDLRRLWTAVEQAGRLRPKTPEKLLELPASRRVVEAREAKTKEQQEEAMFLGSFAGYDPRAPQKPGAAIAQHGLIQQLSSILDGNRFGFIID